MARGSSRRARGLSVKIKTKGGTIFEVDEKVARIFGKLRYEMTYNGSFQRSSSNQAVTRIHSPPTHSLTPSCSIASLNSSLNSLIRNHDNQQTTNRQCPCSHSSSDNKTDNNVKSQPNNGNDTVDEQPRSSNSSPEDDCHSSLENDVPPDNEESNEASCDSGCAESSIPTPESPNKNSSNGTCSETCKPCPPQPRVNPHPPRRLYPDLDYNVITLDKIRGGIFALMLRWAKHHMNDPLVEYMERQEELRNTDGNVHGASLFKTPATYRKGSKSPATKSPCAAMTTFNSVYRESAKDKICLDEVPPWDAKFFSKLSRPQIYEMLHACSNLQVPLLTEMLAKTVADQMRGKSVEEVREEFGIVSDYTPEEEAALKEDYDRYVGSLIRSKIN